MNDCSRRWSSGSVLYRRPAFESHRFRSRCLLSAAFAAFTATVAAAAPVAVRGAASGADGGRDSEAPMAAAVATAAPRAVAAAGTRAGPSAWRAPAGPPPPLCPPAQGRLQSPAHG